MPQVSVTPAKTSPAPTNADRPRKAGWTNAPSRRAEKDQRPGGDPHLPLQRDRPFPLTTGSPARSQASVPPSTLTTLRVAGGQEPLARLTAPAARSADRVKRLVRPAVAGLHDRPRVDRVERHQPGGAPRGSPGIPPGVRTSISSTGRPSPPQPPQLRRRDCRASIVLPSRFAQIDRRPIVQDPAIEANFPHMVPHGHSPCYNIVCYLTNYIPDRLYSQAMAAAIPDEFLDLMAEKFRMLSDSTRLAILRA